MGLTGTVKNVFGLSGTTVTLTGGITPANVTWNFNGPAFSSSDVGVAITSGATVPGTFLAPNQSIVLDHGNVTGEVIGGGFGALVSIHSGSTVTAPTPSVPEPSSLLLLGAGLAGIATWGNRRRS